MFILVNESAVVTDKPVSSMILKRVERESAPSFPVASSIIYWPIFSQVQVNGLSGGCLNDGVSWTNFFFFFFFLNKKSQFNWHFMSGVPCMYSIIETRVRVCRTVCLAEDKTDLKQKHYESRHAKARTHARTHACMQAQAVSFKPLYICIVHFLWSF